MTARPPLIGLSGRRGFGAALGVPVGFADAPLDISMSEYATSVIAAGGLPVILPLDADPRALVARLDGLVLAGGEDVDPRRYGAHPDPLTGPCSLERDSFEFALARAAIERQIPVLGICRGAQLLNVVRGGTLIQDLPRSGLPGHGAGVQGRREVSHAVATVPGSVLARLVGEGLDVNSFHHQGLDVLGAELRATAHAPDGLVEAIEFIDAPVVAVQWHPETMGGDPLFSWLVETAIDHPRDPALPEGDGAAITRA